MNLHEEKKVFRTRLRELRDSLPSELRLLWSRQIIEVLSCQPAWLAANKPALYASFGSEVNTLQLLEERYQQGLPVILPQIYSDGRMTFHEITLPPSQLTKTRFGYPAPDPECDPQIPDAEIDLVVVPAVGFDRYGNRLGQGKGYYDRFLHGLDRKVPRIGIAFEEQVVAHLPTSETDEPIPLVITQHTLYAYQRLEWESHSVEQTHHLAELIATSLKPPVLLGLKGDLGTGKTEWTRGFLKALGWQGRVKSPTFSLEQVYPLADGTQVIHLDGYRLDPPSELDRDWLDEIFSSPNSYILVEWPERFGDEIPFSAPLLSFAHRSENHRHIRWEAFEKSHHLTI